MVYYGHTKENPATKEVLPCEHWQLLREHLLGVSRLSEEKAKKFGAGKVGAIIGLAHDLGKYSYEFQQRLQGSTNRVDHATAGAQKIHQRFGRMLGRAMAYTIVGHHGGLPDGNKGDAKNLPSRLDKQDIPDYQAFKQEIDIPEIIKEDLASLPVPKEKSMNCFSHSFFIRMLYSCLVDADYLDTERFMNPDKFAVRPVGVSLQALLERLQEKMAEISRRNQQNPSAINAARHSILQRCMEMAEAEPGMFTLTVPTGGGKTYSSLAFGLKHAVKHQKDRVIYVIPYTSIIEQNASVFRDALQGLDNDDVVLEHHSNFEYPELPFDDWDVREKAHRLAAENWDMPVVVTTAVQFFESLFACKGSRCRKLHNITNSVIILDEAQMMPLEYLRPCLWALTELVFNYQATVVLCTATQPAVHHLLPAGLRIQEIMEDPQELQQSFKRVHVEYGGDLSDEGLASAMAASHQVLAIVNTRRHARLLFDKLSGKTAEGIYHLSARMCPAHRKMMLAQIRQVLLDKQPCRVVATQLIEAGVDVDFPTVYRSMAGIDSIAQAAGRCNREGKRLTGQVIVFEPEKHGMPDRGLFSLTAGLTRSTARNLSTLDNDLLSLKSIEYYFRQLLDVQKDQLDARGILRMIDEGREDMAFPFAGIAKDFQFIDECTVSLVVPWDEQALEMIDRLAYHPLPASRARLLQPYVVQVYQHEIKELEKEGVVRMVGDFIRCLTDRDFYDDRVGLLDAKSVKAPAAVLMF